MSLPKQFHLACKLIILSLIVASNFSVAQTVPTVADQIGYSDLLLEFGDSLPDGSSSNVALIEAFRDAPGGYLPNPSQFPGKTFNDLGEPPPGEVATDSRHATTSARNFVGPNSSSPSTNAIDVFSADHWLGEGGLNSGSSQAPVAHSYKVSSHSYILQSSENFGETQAASLLQRLDYYIDSNDSLVVVGTTNNTSTDLPLGLVPAYNALAVGVTDGDHGAGPTTFYGASRTKVDIVAPALTTSIATPIVSSVASLLVDAANGNSDATHVETLKATLLAGATKDDVADWDRTQTRPLDERYGAGQVNAYNSFKIQEGGQFEGTSQRGGPAVESVGWDYSDSLESTSSSQERFYRFEVNADQYLNELSIALVWNFDVIDLGGNPNSFIPSPNLVNLDLELFDSSGNLVDASLSTVDNVEHIFLSNLEPGFYDLKLSGNQDSDFALAWHLTGSTLPGDFNLDRQVNIEDIDFYSGNLDQPAEGELAVLDLDADGQVTLNDLDLHVTTLVQTSAGGYGTTIGDTNLDGQTDILIDAFTLVGNIGKNAPVSYADGDFNADGKVDVLGDAFRLVENLGLAAGNVSPPPSTSVVPEPGSSSILGLLFAGQLLLRSRRYSD